MAATSPTRSQFQTCADFPDLACCDGCHIDWELLADAAEAHRHTYLPWVCLPPDGAGYALVCCTVAVRLAARGWRWLHITGVEEAPEAFAR